MAKGRQVVTLYIRCTITANNYHIQLLHLLVYRYSVALLKQNLFLITSKSHIASFSAGTHWICSTLQFKQSHCNLNCKQEMVTLENNFDARSASSGLRWSNLDLHYLLQSPWQYVVEALHTVVSKQLWFCIWFLWSTWVFRTTGWWNTNIKCMTHQLHNTQLYPNCQHLASYIIKKH